MSNDGRKRWGPGVSVGWTEPREAESKAENQEGQCQQPGTEEPDEPDEAEARPGPES